MNPSPTSLYPMIPALSDKRQPFITRPILLRVACVFALCCAMPSAIQAAVVEGAQPKDWPANPQKHAMVVLREASNKAEARMIAIAEAAYPTQAEVQKAAGGKPVADAEKLWWYKQELGIRIPYAITAEALTYYSGLIEGYRKKAFTRYVEPSSRLEYRASAKRHEEYSRAGTTYQDVHVVTLKLSFSQSFAATNTEGMTFTKERIVILHRTGKVLHVDGDGPTEVPILAI